MQVKHAEVQLNAFYQRYLRRILKDRDHMKFIEQHSPIHFKLLQKSN